MDIRHSWARANLERAVADVDRALGLQEIRTDRGRVAAIAGFRSPGRSAAARSAWPAAPADEHPLRRLLPDAWTLERGDVWLHARLVSPDGTYVADERLPYFRLQPWVRDHFAVEPAAEPAEDSAARPAGEPAATASRAP
ncbi:hypothetical protein ACFV4Q_10905 [Streptomyces nojiriensis]|uniref:hypothetical protein n=1 Tax=Streptomyces nojiriensis TaxID=66374 RepID=UPI0036618D98